MVSNVDELLQIFDAASGMLIVGDACTPLGDTGQDSAMLAVVEYLRHLRLK